MKDPSKHSGRGLSDPHGNTWCNDGDIGLFPEPCPRQLETPTTCTRCTQPLCTQPLLLLQVDIWTETLEASEYDALAMMIAKGVTTEVDTPTEAGPDVEDGRGSVAGSADSVTDERKNSLAR